MTGNRSEVADVAHCVEEILASARTSFSEDELRKHTEYLSASAWRFSTTLSVARNHYALPLQGSCIVDIGAYPGHIAAVLSQIDKANVTAVTLITNPQFESLMSSLGVRVAL